MGENAGKKTEEGNNMGENAVSKIPCDTEKKESIDQKISGMELRITKLERSNQNVWSMLFAILVLILAFGLLVIMFLA